MSEVPWKRIAAEAVAIVASILLAFSIDAWWEGRSEIEMERRILTALLAEFDKNGELLREARRVFEQRYLESLRILELLDEGISTSDHTEFKKLFNGLLFARSFHLESGAHDALLESGELSLIRGEELKNSLAAWPSYVREWSEEHDSVFSFVHNAIRPFLAESLRIRDISGNFAPFPDGESPPQAPTGDIDVDSIINVSTSNEFDNLVHRRAQGLWFVMRDGETLLVQVSVISRLIRENLEQ